MPTRFFTYAYSHTSIGVALSVVGLLIVVFGCARLSRSAEGRLISLLALAPLAEAALVWAGGMHIFALRNLIATGPFMAVAVAAALGAVPKRAAVAMGVSAIALLAVPFTPIGHGAAGTPPYDDLARSLVAQGWTPSQPVAVFGNIDSSRSPLEWYLPHRPVLDEARLTSRVCKLLFVVRGDDVQRLRLTRPIRAEPALRGATILVGPATAPRCLRPIRTGRLAALS